MCPTCLLIAGIEGKVQDFWRRGADVCEYTNNWKLLARALEICDGRFLCSNLNFELRYIKSAHFAWKLKLQH